MRDWAVLGFVCIFISNNSPAATNILVPTGSVWKYLDDGSNQGTAWTAPGFDDSAWKSGPAQLGYGDGDEATVIGFGPNSASKYITSYFRRSFSVADPAAYTNLTFRLLRDDGAVIYLNGVEVYRDNMPGGVIAYTTLASANVAGADESAFFTTNASLTRLVAGINVLAVEVHQAAASSLDISFDVELLASGPGGPINITLNAPSDGAAIVGSSAGLNVTAVSSTGNNLSITYYGRPIPPPAGADFTIIALPDTQYYVSTNFGGSPTTFVAQTEWILSNKAPRNIAYVAQLGDCVQNGDATLGEWLNATNALYRLEDPVRTLLPEGLPYGVAVGNHDQSPVGQASGTTINYNQFFGENHFLGRTYYGGHYGTNNDNSYELFSASGLDFVVVYLEFDPAANAAVLSWANTILQTYSNHRAIVVSHYIINAGNPATFGPQGQAIYNALRGNPNLFLMLCGHITEEGQRQDVFNGNTVYSVLSDYQARTRGGDGWLRMMEFSPSNNVIRVMTYSPTLRQFETDANSQFTLPYNMQGGAGFAAIQTNLNVASGASDSALWSALAPDTEYEWYVTAADGLNTISSPVQRFRTSLSAAPDPTVLTRGPYLQLGTPTGIVIRWRTDLASGATVRYGTTPGNLSNLVSDITLGTEHVVRVANLQPDTTYYYQVGTLNKWFTPVYPQYFVTAPVPGTPQPTRIWVLGDSGTADLNAQTVRNAYLQYATNGPADLCLMLGDNAYNSGTDTEYQNAVFNMYPMVLANTVLWPTLGNHDTAQSATPPSSLPYFQIFTLPTQGEAGGVASGTPRYYSFDYANIHFVCLDSMTSDRSRTGPMLTWLSNDLLNTTQEWLIAFWHHPPYTKGSHNSDTEANLIEMRANALPILEANGVDLVLTGHSHSYERSYFINGHYGSSTTFSVTNKVDGGDGRLDGSGGYYKPSLGAANRGAVYAVAGSSGRIGGGTLNHPAMFISLNQLGSMILEVAGQRLDVKFLRETGAIDDHFTILKPPPLAVAPTNGRVIVSWPGNIPGFTLEAKTDLVSSPWAAVNPAPRLIGNQFIATNTPSVPIQFYRLNRP